MGNAVGETESYFLAKTKCSAPPKQIKPALILNIPFIVHTGGMFKQSLYLTVRVYNNNNNYKTSIAPISSKRIELSGTPSTEVGQTHSPGTMQGSSTIDGKET